MIRGLYTSGWSMLANTRKMDVITNNLANVNTTAFKKDGVVFESFPELLTQRIKDTNGNATIGNMSLGSDVGEIHTYNTPGQMLKTDSKLDLALSDTNTGVSYFAVGVTQPNGSTQEYYTRDGSFALDSTGRLVDKQGNLVLGQNGAITLTSEDFNVTQDGKVFQNGTQIDTLKIVTFANPDTLRKVGNNLVSTTAESTQTDFTGNVSQGYLEQSNVNVVREMVDMISVSRAYEASQKALQAQDGTLDKAVNQIGSIR
jgi:fagellar hook-basal body proteins